LKTIDEPKSRNGLLTVLSNGLSIVITLIISTTTICGAWWGLQLRMERVITAQRIELTSDLISAKTELLANQVSLEKAMLTQDARWADRLSAISRDFDGRISAAIKMVKSDQVSRDSKRIEALTVEIEKLRAALRPQPP